jgi:hypothetical protein
MIRIQILNPGNAHVKEGKEEGRFALIDGNEFIDYLDHPFICTPIGFRAKGLRVSRQDPNDIKEFFTIPAINRIKEISHDPQYFWYWGPEFIVQFQNMSAGLFLCTSTLRDLAHDFKKSIGKEIKIGLKKVDTGSFYFYLPEIYDNIHFS